MQKYRYDFLFILLIIIAGSLALFFKIGDIPPLYPWSDESEIAADAVGTLKAGAQFFYPGQLASGSLAVWLEAGWLTLFGRSLLGLRLLNGLVNLASMLALYLLVRQLPLPVEPGGLQSQHPLDPAPNRRLALVAALLLAVSTWLLGLGRIAAPNWSLVPVLTSLAFYCFWLGLNTRRRRYFVASGTLMGLLFYGYIPGYFVPLVPLLFLALIWLLNRPRQATADRPSATRYPLSAIRYLLLAIVFVAGPMLIFFALDPVAVLQRPWQLAETNQLGAAGSIGQGAIDLLSTFGLFPNWLWQGQFEQLAFDPLVTVLFVVGLLAALRRWREPGYLFLLLWWGVMISPVLLSRSASLGFIFEVWRRGVGAQPVSFILAAGGALLIASLITHLVNVAKQRLGKSSRSIASEQPGEQKHGGRKSGYSGKINLPLRIAYCVPSTLLRAGLRKVLGYAIRNMQYVMIAALIMASAGLSYRLYFEQWANSPAIPALFAEAPVRLVEWMAAAGGAETLFLFPIRPNVSPTTRPELFTVRYLYEGPAEVAFPVMAETTVDQTLAGLLAGQPTTVKLMMPERLPIDPKGYFEYALGGRSQVVARHSLPDYSVTTYRLRPGPALETGLEAVDIAFGQALRLTGRRLQPVDVAAGQTLAVALRWAKTGPEAIDYNARLSLYDRQDYERVRLDKPLLSAGDYSTSRHWSPGSESTLYYALPIPVDAPPGPYSLRLLAYEVESGRPLPPVGGQTDLSLNLAELEVAPNPTAVDPATLSIAQPIEASYPGGLRLIGLASSAGSINRPGDRLRLTLLWQVSEPPAYDFGLIPTLTTPDGEPIPLIERPQPLIADYPTTAWPVGQVYRVNYPLWLPAGLASGTYRLAFRLVDLATAEPLAEQVLVPLAVEARPHHFEAPALPHRLNVDFGQAIRLLGFEVGTFSPGQELAIKLQWQARREMPVSYKVFLHLIDAAGRIVGQVDALPQQGAAPTTGWVSGEIIEDELKLPIPEAMSPGFYRLVVGWYDEKTGERLRTAQGDQVVLIEEEID